MYQEILSYLKKAVWLIMLVAIFILYEKGGFNPAVVCMVTLTFCVWALFQIALSEEKLINEETKTYEAPPTPIPLQNLSRNLPAIRLEGVDQGRQEDWENPGLKAP